MVSPRAVPSRSGRFTHVLLPGCPLQSSLMHSIRMSGVTARILIVEDDPDIAQLVARYLDKAGYTTTILASGREALRAIGAQPPDLLILDLMLPQVDGLEICRAVRSNP